MNDLKILMISPIFLPKRDGTTHLIKNLADGLSNRGHTVTVITRLMRNTASCDVMDGITVLRVPAVQSSFYGRIKFAMLSSALVFRLGLRNGFDVIHAFGTSAILCAVLGNIHRKKIITTFPGLPEEILAGFDSERRIKNQVASIALRILGSFCRVITTPTVNASTEIKKAGGRLIEGRIQIVPNPLNLTRFHKLVVVKDGEFYPEILTVGNLAYRKGFDLVIRAMSKVVQEFPKARLTIVGKGPQKERLENLRSQLHLERNVEFADSLSDIRLAELYNLCDFFVSASREGGEAFSYVIVEAMAAAKPVIASRTPGPTELISNSGAGLLFEPENVRELSDTLRSLARNKPLIEDLGAKGETFVKEKIELGKVSVRFENIYLGK